ncbi:MAG: glycosyltransferase [Candidatus Bathyarchaeia archaeon]
MARSGSLRTKVAKFTNRHKLSNKVHLLGYIKIRRVSKSIESAKALIVPSICPENCPLITLEAISVGTPEIASN